MKNNGLIMSAKYLEKNIAKQKDYIKSLVPNIFKTRLKVAEKHYKNIMDENILKFNRDMRIKMREMRFKNPKEFWNIFRNDKKREKTKMPTETLFEFF